MGISVNELRKMGEQGKITTDVMFGVTSQLETLRSEADKMLATVSDGMVLLGDAVMQFVGKADKAAGSSSILAAAVVGLSDAVKNSTDEPWFDKVFGQIGNDAGWQIAMLAGHVKNLSDAVAYLSSQSPDEMILDLNTALGGSVRTAKDFELALADAEQAVASLATNTKGQFGSVIQETETGVVTLGDAVQDLFQQALEGKGSAEKARAAIIALGSVGDPEFADLQGTITSAIAKLYEMRDAANAAHAAAARTTTDLGSFPSPLDMETAFAKPVKPPPRPGKGKSPAQRFEEDMEQLRRRTPMMAPDPAVLACLNITGASA